MSRSPFSDCNDATMNLMVEKWDELMAQAWITSVNETIATSRELAEEYDLDIAPATRC